MGRRSRTLRAWLVILFLTLQLLLVLMVLSMNQAPCESLSNPDTQASFSVSIHKASTSVSEAATAGSDIMEEELKGAAEDLAKLVALFSHPLYNLPTPPVPDGDWLLKVRTKTKKELHSTQQW